MMARLVVKLLTFPGSKLRNRYVLRFIRFCSSFRVLRQLACAWDPNVIRRNWAVGFDNNLYPFRLNGYTLYIDLNDHIGYWTFLRRQPFDVTALEIASRIRLNSSHVFLDVGAHTGTVSVALCSALGCESYAIEASKSNGSLLLRNLHENNIRSRVAIVALVSANDRNKFLPLYVRRGNTGSNSIKQGWNPSLEDVVPELVPTCALDDLVTEEVMSRIGLIKIDVEGAEEDVLQGASTLLSQCKAPILMEYRVDALKRYLGKDGHGLVSLVERTHVIYEIGENLELAPFDPSKPAENILAIHREARGSILSEFAET